MAGEFEKSGEQKVLYAATGFNHMPITRQLGILIGFAAAVALGISVVLWTQKPSLRPLYKVLDPQDASQVADALNQAGIQHEVNNTTGAILVPGDQVYKARMALAAKGLPRGIGKGFELLDKNPGLGSSQFMERARYLRALEGELVRTISSFDSVRGARVHLAVPKRSLFARDKRKPTASVFVDLYSGRQLGKSQVDGIVHLVAASIPELSSDAVTVVDQLGRLLTENFGNEYMAIADKQIKYTHKLEESYSHKIETLLAPILGSANVKARVSADIDFTRNEKTHEAYNPDFPALRSEQLMSESKANTTAGGGIPGALSNRPTNDEENGGSAENSNKNERRQSTKNYELDKTISYTANQTGKLRRLSVAVLVDNHTAINPKNGKVTRRPLTAEEITNITKLVRDAIGFDPQRGDKVTVINKEFLGAPPIEEGPELSFWEQPWFWDLVKQLLGMLFIVFMAFGVLRPMFKNLTSKGLEIKSLLDKQGAGGIDGPLGSGAGGRGAAGELDGPSPLNLSRDEQMQLVKNMAGEDPKRVAQVVKKWLESD